MAGSLQQVHIDLLRTAFMAKSQMNSFLSLP